MNTKRKYSAFYILLGLLLVISIIFLLEIVFRVTHLFGSYISYSEPHDQIMWRYTPGRTYWYKGENDYPVTGKINKFGWRDREWSIRKKENTYRIAVLGDSFVEAFQVESDRGFTALTEKALNGNKNYKVELMNFGRSGATQTEELWVLKNEVMRFSPDMVILFFCAENDITDVRWETARTSRPYYHVNKDGELVLDTSFTESFEYKLKTFINPLKQHSAIISFMTTKYVDYNARKKRVVRDPSGFRLHELRNAFLSLATMTPDNELSKSYKMNKLLMKTMSDYCKARGIRFMLVSNDNSRAYVPDDEKQYKFLDPTFNSYFFEDDLREFAISLDIDYIGLHRIFRQYYEENKIRLHWGPYEINGIPVMWGHWNYQGHEVVAKALTDKLTTYMSNKKPD